ncbi:MAG: copper chaperone [Nitrospirae bacterium]|nr:MAG: copper chaperone [Nitrospirota bacterium]
MAETTFKIEGMHCQHCVMRVQKALNGVEGVTSAEVQIGSARVNFDESKTQIETLKKAIEEAGYKVVV